MTRILYGVNDRSVSMPITARTTVCVTIAATILPSPAFRSIPMPFPPLPILDLSSSVVSERTTIRSASTLSLIPRCLFNLARLSATSRYDPITSASLSASKTSSSNWQNKRKRQLMMRSSVDQFQPYIENSSRFFSPAPVYFAPATLPWPRSRDTLPGR